MRTIDAGDAGTIDLSDLIFTAKIDYLTVFTSGKVPLPKLAGKPKWARGQKYQKLSVHDASRQDIESLIEQLGNLPLAEIEVAADIGSKPGTPPDHRAEIIDALMVHLIAKGLRPKVRNKEFEFDFRGVFEGVRTRFRLRPFNRVLPSPHGQQLHGRRHDPLQVKGYGKKIDQGAELDASQWVARTEVRLSGKALDAHGLENLSDLLGFRYRKDLMPYFRHVRGVKLRASRADADNPMLVLLKGKLQEYLDAEWARVGVGSVLRGGKFDGYKVRLLSDTAVNDRIGQALLRLEKGMNAKFVCEADHATQK